MFCWQARRMMADLIEGSLPTHHATSMARHMDKCAACRTEREAMTSIAAQVRLAAPDALPASAALNEAFTLGVLAQARERSVSTTGHVAAIPRPGKTARRLVEPTRMLRPLGNMLPIAAAGSILVLAPLVAFIYGGWRSAPEDRPMESPGPVADLDRHGNSIPGFPDDAWSARSDQDFDTLLPPREILFSVRQDLVGVRNGRIPLTTYVLEPPPEENAVVRASF